MFGIQNPSNKLWHLSSIFITAITIVSFISPIIYTTVSAAGVPQLIYPENFTNTTILTDPPLGIPTFKWSSVDGANVYRLQVDGEIGFNQPISLDITTRNNTYTPYSIGHLLSDGEWYWRVRVEDPAPAGEWSQIRRFTKTWATTTNKPELLWPADGEQLPFFDSPTFSWSPVMGASRYRFQIALTQWGFDNPVLTVDTLTTTHQPYNRLSNGLYYWRIVPMDAMDRFGTPSDVRAFTAAYGTNLHDFPEMVPTLISPADGSYPTFTPTFHWTAVEGAEKYQLQYTSDELCDFTGTPPIDTRQTSYTPTTTFPNDFRYCWRVRVTSGAAVGDWSEIWTFQKNWDLKPILLTPTQLYQTALYPVYSWTPVPGAASYLIQLSTDHFSTIYEQANVANTFYTQQNYDGNAHYWWRVIPIDGSGNQGVLSDEAEFQSNSDSIAPILIYPQYFYLPDNYPGVHMYPYEDRTVALPVFIWHRVMGAPTIGGVFANAYRIQIAETPYFNPVIWQYDTENTSATPTTSDDFTPLPTQVYYWRVCPLDHLGGTCLYPEPSWTWWSQIWKARFNDQLMLSPTSGPAPELLRPAPGQESVEATPLLEWWPFTDIDQNPATQYQVQISRVLDFSSIEIDEYVNIPVYSPNQSLAQRSLGRMDYGSFYWRVRGLTEIGWSNWSETWRFQIASQSEWKYDRTIGNPSNQVLIGSDPVTDTIIVPDGYNLSTLYASQDLDSWYFGFNTEISTTSMTYVFYLDLDNTNGSGATYPPERNYFVTTNPDHQPEYAIYIDEINGVVNAQNTWVYTWSSGSWGFGSRLDLIGGQVYTTDEYVELRVPGTAIGMALDTNSTSIMLFSVNITNGVLQDTVPSDPAVPGSGSLTRFSAVSDHMNLIFPFNTATGDPTTITSVTPFYWDWPTGSYGTTPFAGSNTRVDVDQNYIDPPEALIQVYSSTSYFSKHGVSLSNDIVGDNIYYWKVQPRYMYPGYPDGYGTWTKGWSFHRIGLKAQNLTTSITFATPTFNWDMAEGALLYRLQVSLDPNFGYSDIDITTPMNSYTPPNTLAQGSYYWRVFILRAGNIWNDSSVVEQFTLTLPTPTGLSPDLVTIHTTPTFCWSPLVGYVGNEKVLTAWKYHLQVSRDPNFSTTYDGIDTFNNCWTPTIGYMDGTYYWRVAFIDGNNRVSNFSSPASFTKQYPITTLISPVNEPVPYTPTFLWTPVDGASTYLLEVSWFPTFYPAFESIESINTQYTPTGIYESDKIFYWRVAIRDRYGNLGPFTDATIIIGEGYPTFLPVVLK